MFYKPKNSNNKLNYSNIPVESENIIPTVIQDSKIKTNNNYGYSIFDIENGAKQNRKYYHMLHNLRERKIILDEYIIGEDATSFNNWIFNKRIKTNFSWY